MGFSYDKGRRLERAIALIEEVILSTNEKIGPGCIKIYPNYTKLFDGYKHEVDIAVELKFDSGYESLFLFECKNTAQKVDKNIVDNFSTKINDFEATKGFIISNDFTSGAIALASRKGRIELLHSKEYDNESVVSIANFSTLLYKVTHIHHLVFSSVNNAGNMTPLNDSSLITKHGSVTPFRDCVIDLAMQLVGELQSSSDFYPTDEGIHNLCHFGKLNIEHMEICVNNIDCISVYMKVSAEYELSYHPIELAFDIENKGSVVSWDKIQISDHQTIKPTLVRIDGKTYLKLEP